MKEPRRRPLLLPLAAGALLMAAGCSLFNQELPNESPKVEVSLADTLRVARGGKVTFEVSASDEDDDPLAYRWDDFGAGAFTDTSANITTWTAPEIIASQSEFFLITVTITDHQPDTEDVVENFLVEVVQRLPELVAPADTIISFRDPPLVLGASGSDVDGDALDFLWDFVEGDRFARLLQRPRPDSSTATILPLVPENARIRLGLTDGLDTVSQEIVVTVQVPTLPAGGMVTLERRVADGSLVSYEMDVYEYPNGRGLSPRIAASWFEAYALCQAEGKRLCSSAEWQNACTGPDSLVYSSTDDPEILPSSFGLRFCNTEGSDLAGEAAFDPNIAPSGSFPNCTADTGVYDLTGSAFEWTMDDDFFQGRIGGFSPAGGWFRGECDTDFSLLTPLPFADELDLSDPAVVDSLLAEPTYSQYGESSYGFRCCR